MMKGMLKLGVVLGLYATIACVGLAVVYSGTKDAIAAHQQRELEAALFELFPAADGFEDISGSIQSPNPGVRFVNEYRMSSGGNPVGIAIRAAAASYGGEITSLIGVGIDRMVAGVKILANKDTPGLGANAANPAYFVDKRNKRTFYDQFAGKEIAAPFRVKEDVIAITASTITSTAVANTVKAAAQAAGAWLDTLGGSK